MHYGIFHEENLNDNPVALFDGGACFLSGFHNFLTGITLIPDIQYSSKTRFGRENGIIDTLVKFRMS